MGNSQEPYNGDPSFVAKSRPAWKNWLIAALVLAGCGILTLFTDPVGTLALIAWGGTLVCLIGAGVSALMRDRS